MVLTNAKIDSEVYESILEGFNTHNLGSDSLDNMKIYKLHTAYCFTFNKEFIEEHSASLSKIFSKANMIGCLDTLYYLYCPHEEIGITAKDVTSGYLEEINSYTLSESNKFSERLKETDAFKEFKEDKKECSEDFTILDSLADAYSAFKSTFEEMDKEVDKEVDSLLEKFKKSELYKDLSKFFSDVDAKKEK